MTSQLETDLILAHIDYETCANQLRFAQYYHKEDPSKQNRKRVQERLEALVKAEVRKNKALTAIDENARKIAYNSGTDDATGFPRALINDVEAIAEDHDRNFLK